VTADPKLPETPTWDTDAAVPQGSGDSSALARLFEEHNASLVSFLRARLNSDQEARDVAQEAYVRLLQLDRVDAISYLRTYLFRTALNIANDRRRSAAVRVSTHRDPLFAPTVDERSPDRSAIAQDDLRAIDEALKGLPAKARYAFLLHRFAELEIEDIATHLAVSERMVRNYLIKALTVCREAIGKTPP